LKYQKDTLVTHENQERNNKIILFDGVCNLCSGFLYFVYRRDAGQLFKFAWIQEEQGKIILKRFDLPENKSDTIVLIDEGKPYTKSTAFLRIISHLKFPWPLMKIGYLLPRFIRDGIYDWVARNRYKWFGKKDACMIPTGTLSERFQHRDSSNCSTER